LEAGPTCRRIGAGRSSSRIRSPCPAGRQLVTFDAGNYIAGLTRKEYESDHWQVAIEALLMAAEGRGPLMHARVGVIRALNGHVEREFNPDRKDHYWGKRKLKRDT
jgi:hypothetical protein